MRIEHLAFNTRDAVAVSKWYIENLGFSLKRSHDEPPHMHFLADETGNVMIEVYANSAAPVPDYRAMNPLVLHLALVSNDIEADIKRLSAAGATQEGEIQRTAQGDQLAMLRDPWGFALQLVNRSSPMI